MKSSLKYAVKKFRIMSIKKRKFIEKSKYIRAGVYSSENARYKGVRKQVKKRKLLKDKQIRDFTYKVITKSNTLLYSSSGYIINFLIYLSFGDLIVTVLMRSSLLISHIKPISSCISVSSWKFSESFSSSSIT
jgi:hypothetical protein